MDLLIHGITCAASAYQGYQAYNSYGYKIPKNFIDFTETPNEIIDRPVYFYLHDELDNPLSAIGNYLNPSSDLVIMMCPAYFQDTDPKIQKQLKHFLNFGIKHEFFHLKNSDSFMCHLVPTITSIAFAILGILTLTPLSGLLLTIIATATSKVAYSHFAENRADDFAINNGLVA